MNMFSKVFGTRSQREVKRIMPLVEKIESLRPDMQKLSDEELKGKTRSRQACSWNGTFPCAAYRWYHSPSGTYRRDENR